MRGNIRPPNLIEAFWCFFQRPQSGEVFNMGGGRHSNCSMLEAIGIAEELSGRPMRTTYDARNWTGDHVWWLSDTRKFQSMYPEWSHRYDVRGIMDDICCRAGHTVTSGRVVRRRNLLGVSVSSTDYDEACEVIRRAALERRPLTVTVTALAMHDVMTEAFDPRHCRRLNALSLVVPDGRPVRWGLNLLYRDGLPDRVCGPKLMLRVCEVAEAEALSIGFYGSKAAVLEELRRNLLAHFPRLRVAAMMPSLRPGATGSLAGRGRDSAPALRRYARVAGRLGRATLNEHAALSGKRAGRRGAGTHLRSGAAARHGLGGRGGPGHRRHVVLVGRFPGRHQGACPARAARRGRGAMRRRAGWTRLAALAYLCTSLPLALPVTAQPRPVEAEGRPSGTTSWTVGVVSGGVDDTYVRIAADLAAVLDTTPGCAWSSSWARDRCRTSTT